MTKQSKDNSPSRPLKRGKGELWLEFKLSRSWAGSKKELAMLESIVAFAEREKLGTYTGRSSGGGAMDLTLRVVSRPRVAEELRKHILSTFPKATFSISDDFEAAFFDPHRKPPKSMQLRK